MFNQELSISICNYESPYKSGQNLLDMQYLKKKAIFRNLQARGCASNGIRHLVLYMPWYTHKYNVMCSLFNLPPPLLDTP